MITKKSLLIGVCVSKEKAKLKSLVEDRLDYYHGDATLIRFTIEDLNLEELHVKGECLEKTMQGIEKKKRHIPHS